MKHGIISNADIDAEEDIATIEVNGAGILWLQFTVGVANLSALKIQGRVTGGAQAYFQLAGAGADFTGPVHPVLKASGDLTTAAFGATQHFVKVNVEGLQSVRIRAAGTNSTITGVYSLR